MAINPKKVLIIVNTNTATGISPQPPSMLGYATLKDASTANADYYASARGLATNGKYLKMGFDFGSLWNRTMTPKVVTPPDWNGIINVTDLLPTVVTDYSGTTTAYSALPLIAAVDKFVVDYGIEAILVDCNVPPFIYVGASPFSGNYIPTECFLALAPTYNSLPIPTVPDTNGTGTRIESFRFDKSLPTGLTRESTLRFGYLSFATFPKSNALQVFKSNQLAISLPNGRIGYLGATPADVQRVVTDAIWAEKQDNRGKAHLVGGKRYPDIQSETINVTCNYQFATNQFTNLYRFDAESFPEYSGTMISVADYGTGNVPLTLFGVIYGGGSQDPRDYLPEATTLPLFNGTFSGGESGYSGIYKSYTAHRGGWGYLWQSSAYMFGRCVFLKGGCASVNNASEPMANGIPQQLEFTVNLLSGISIMESAYLSAGMSALRTTVYGDPLYSPYKLTSVSPNEFLL